MQVHLCIDGRFIFTDIYDGQSRIMTAFTILLIARAIARKTCKKMDAGRLAGTLALITVRAWEFSGTRPSAAA